MSHPNDATHFPMTQGFESDASELDKLRLDVARMRARNQEMMELLNCPHPDKLVHDLRNVLNEMQLLRLLAKMDA